MKLAEEALGNSQQHLDLRNPKWVNVRRQNDKALAAIRAARQSELASEALADQFRDATKMIAEPYMNLNCPSVQARLATVWGYVKAEPVRQEPVTFPANGLLQQEPSRSITTGSQNNGIIQPFAYYCDELSADGRLIDREYNGINQFSAGRFGKPLYAAPVDAKAIRAEALEEAAKVIEAGVLGHGECAAAIRGLK